MLTIIPIGLLSNEGIPGPMLSNIILHLQVCINGLSKYEKFFIGLYYLMWTQLSLYKLIIFNHTKI